MCLQQYVQDLMREDSSNICDLIINSNAHVYVCGAAAMAERVNNTLQVLIIQLLLLLEAGFYLELYNNVVKSISISRLES